ncbi:TolC family outer membrane protein [Acidovorax sp. Be4]|uniref:TolC family outer membrane protein n=1 Tax=Acidovorax bellezanensis TaxID=2976702 RepID=A0ABT2PMX6_9BURK|nr:TolC family outer membrane protein [Acidovorax sp. Be4]MCT9811836.1 TolC family outer membrane protein [Acidovorax sp. Be4]
MPLARTQMNFPRWACLAAALGALTPSAQAQSLVELTERARSFDAIWQARQAETDAAYSRAEQARAGLLPSVGLQAGVSRARTEISRPSFTLNATTQTAALNASQPLYRPANRIAFTQGQRGYELALAQREAAEQDLIVRTSQAYFDVLGAEDSLRYVRAQKTAVAEQRAFAQRNFDVGNATITDFREAQARHDLIVAQEIASENELRVKRLALEQLVGVPGAQPLPLAQPVALPPLLPADPQAWVDVSQDTQPQLRQAQLALDVARLETRKAETGHLPTVDLQAGYSVNNYPQGSITIPQNGYRVQGASVGVQLNMPLFAGFSVQNRVKETLALESKAEADLDQARRSVAQATRTAFYGVQSGQGQIKALETAEASSQSALDANRLGYEVGVRVNIDVLNAQSQLYQTKRDLALARYQVILGQLKLRQAAGTLTSDDLQAVNALLASTP